MKKYLLALCLAIMGTTMPMNDKHIHIQQYIPTFNTSMQAVHWGIVGLPFIYNALRLFNSYRTASLQDLSDLPTEDASPLVYEFIISILEPLELGDIDMYIKIDPNAGDETANSFYDRANKRYIGIITLNKSNEKLEELIAKYESQTEHDSIDPELARLIGNIQHEASHIKHNDSFKNRIIAPLLVPFITHFGSKVFSLLLCGTLAINPSALQSALLIPSAIVKYGVSVLLIDAYKRYQEQRADNTIEDKPELLQAQIEQYQQEAERHNGCFARTAPEIIDAYKSGQLSLMSTMWLLKQQFGLNYCSFLIDHPCAQVRADKFQKRLDKLNS